MFCSKCGAENQAEASHCHKCGASLSSVGTQQNSPISPAASSQRHEIWNPNATANWSLIFTPAFGAYLQMLNWKALGESDKAASSQNWFYASLSILIIYVLMGVFMSDSKAADGAVRGLGFLYLLVWYFSAGRAQGRFVKEKFGPNYAKKTWGKALLIGIAAVIGYFILAVFVRLILGAVGASPLVLKKTDMFNDLIPKTSVNPTTAPVLDLPQFDGTPTDNAPFPKGTYQAPPSNSVGDVNGSNSTAFAELHKSAVVAGSVRVSQYQAQESVIALPEIQAWENYLEKSSGGTVHGKVMAWAPETEIVDGQTYWTFNFMETHPDMDHRWESFLVSVTSGEVLVDDIDQNKLLTLDQWRSQKHPLDMIKEN